MLEREGESNTPQAMRPGLAYTILLALWLVGLPFLLYAPLWLGEQIALLMRGSDWGVGWIAALLLHAALVILPAAYGTRQTLSPRYRAVFRTWLLAGTFVLFMLPARLAAPDAAQTAAALQLAGLLLFLIFLHRLPAPLDKEGSGSVATAVVAGLLLALPWVAWGALGSPLDTALNLAAALLFGLCVARLFARMLWPALRADGPAERRDIALGGLAAAAALAVMGSTFGINGQQFILLALLPGLGWAVARPALLAPAREAPTAALIGLAAAGPLLFLDPDELNLMLNLGSRDVAVYAFFATLAGSALGWLLSLAALILGGRPTRLPAAAGVALSLGTLALAAALYFLVGQPGWHGERLFVILADQADTSAAAAIADPMERRAFVYDTLTRHTGQTQGELHRALDRVGVDYTPYYLVNALEVDAGPLLRLWLSRRPEVDRVLSSPELRPLPQLPPVAAGSASAPAMPPWSLIAIRAPNVWSTLGVTGAGIVIGQSDSGVDGAHPELSAQYRGRQPSGPAGDDYNWLDPWNGTTTPADIGGHGTHTLATALGRSVGVAPDASWIACANLPRNLGNPPRYLDCLQFLLAPYPQTGDALADGRPELGAHVLNNSWGCPEIEGCDANALLAAARALRAAGVFVAASAGNDGAACSTIEHPLALYDEVFTVGAAGEGGTIAPFSSRGPVTADGSGRVKPDIVAPGVGVLSAYPGGTFAYNDGTSMAGPHVAGVVALMWSANPALIGDIERTERILTETAVPLDLPAGETAACGATGQRPDNVAGYGMVNALAAVERALTEQP